MFKISIIASYTIYKGKIHLLLVMFAIEPRATHLSLLMSPEANVPQGNYDILHTD